MAEKNEMDVKQLSEQDIEQVAGGDEGGGLTVSWAKLVCPVCHGDVTPGRQRSLFNPNYVPRYICAKCQKTWKKTELVEEG